ncbi:type II toxin-antitoxin system RelE/ParE family toxin [Campylobacter mucosalis]|uniref:Putative toxin-antitoxin system, toxin component, RelE/ParE family n=1 Tax=Campylobacter mucosalis CCUG 21559 TaxID=1032067 RepID=A0A6G5QGD9_9BACT|nr:type II toxin-antitoxin system RelE/ParE family toxin [Campylobacter mucosalis]QCD44637.1 putative toxin-antitoxin system, toxin component, RelE/ParE family [Campylobacter mucosalis CCUG 21559]
MNIKYSRKFSRQMGYIVGFIAQDSKNRAYAFKEQIFKQISTIAFMPYRFRKSPFLDNENIREMISKGYVIRFLIANDTIEILAIYSKNRDKDE